MLTALKVGATRLVSMTKLVEPVTTPLLTTKDVRERVKILSQVIIDSGNAMIARQTASGSPDPVKINFHVGRIATAQTYLKLLNMTPELYDLEVENERSLD